MVQPNLAASLKSWEPPIPSPIPHPNPPAESICMKKERHLDLAVLDERGQASVDRHLDRRGWRFTVGSVLGSKWFFDQVGERTQTKNGILLRVLWVPLTKWLVITPIYSPVYVGEMTHGSDHH